MNAGANADRQHPVSVVKCGSYDRAEVEAAILSSVDLLGGMARFVSPGDRILIKPNMLAARRPDQAVTTHPEVVRAVVRLVKGAGGEIVVGDSPAGPSTERILRNLAEKTGISAVCEQESVPFVLFTEYDTVANEDGRVAKTFDLTKTLQQVDGVVSLAKLKTHSFTRYTGAVKNLFGLVHGLKKAEYHMRMRSPESFSEMLVDLAEHVRPRLTIMDAVEGMDGDGPSGGRKRAVGAILASDNVHALDTVALRIVGEEPQSVWTIRVAVRRGLLTNDPSNAVETRGIPLEEIRVDDFQMPPKERVYGGIVPDALGAFIAEGVARKPVFSKKLCIGCGKCVDICPAGVLTLQRDRTPKVAIRRDGCIRCYCCHEVCPENAVHLRRRPLRSWGNVIHRRIGGRLDRGNGHVAN